MPPGAAVAITAMPPELTPFDEAEPIAVWEDLAALRDDDDSVDNAAAEDSSEDENTLAAGDEEAARVDAELVTAAVQDPQDLSSAPPLSGAPMTPGAVQPPAPTPVAPASPDKLPADRLKKPDREEVWLAVSINGQALSQPALFLRGRDGRLLAKGDDLRQWGFNLPDMQPTQHEGEQYYGLASLPGLTFALIESTQSLVMQAPPSLFAGTVLRSSAGLTIPQLPPLGGFFNYDLVATRVENETNLNGLMEVGIFGRWGAGVASFLARDTSIPNEARYVRLETTWTHDRPGKIDTFRLGDAVSAPGSWGRPVRFGGVQWATNFLTQPGFVTFPLPGLAGETALPSTVDVYVNDALRLRREVPAGPFTIPDLPVVSGQGVARLVVRDLLGRERVITQPYYATPRLLRGGLHEYSYETGFVRKSFGITSNDYGRFATAGTHRFGFTDQFTGEVHGEVLKDQQAVGAGATYLWPGLGLFSASVAASRGERGNGALGGFGYEQQARQLSFGTNTQFTTENFAQLGLQPDERAPAQTSSVFANYATRRFGSFGASYVHQGFRDREQTTLASASYSVNVGKASMGFSLLHFLTGERRTIGALTVSFPLDMRTNASTSATFQGSSRQVLTQVQRSLPAGNGYAYRFLVGAADAERQEAGVSAQNEYGTYIAEAARSANGDIGVRATVSGAVAYLGGNVFLTRRITDSFAVVEMPKGYSDVRVYADNQLVARTRADGTALVPRLRAYQKNAVRLDVSDVPLDTDMGSLEANAVPYFRSGLLLQFAVKRAHDATLTVVLGNGEPVPAGAVAQLVSQNTEFPIGMNGELYLKGLAEKNEVKVTWRGQSCEFPVSFAQTKEAVPHLGTYSCVGIKR
jgi:outer membrane usher protein